MADGNNTIEVAALRSETNDRAVKNSNTKEDEEEGESFCELEALFEDWIVDNTETPMIVPQTGNQFIIDFKDRDGEKITLQFYQDPKLRARELPDDGSCPLREQLSETEKVSATGAVSWNGGVSLGHFCATAAWIDVAGKSVVEVGAGTGVCGIMAAAVGGRVVCTDRDEIIPVLQRNAVANADVIVAALGSLDALEYSWGETSPAGFPGERKFDVILAADCIYDMEGIEPLLKAFKDLSHTSGERVENDDGHFSRTTAFVAYDTAIGHYEVYKVSLLFHAERF